MLPVQAVVIQLVDSHPDVRYDAAYEAFFFWYFEHGSVG